MGDAIDADPGELENLYRVGDGTAERLKVLLNQWMEQETDAPHADILGGDKDALEKLKSLGYIR